MTPIRNVDDNEPIAPPFPLLPANADVPDALTAVRAQIQADLAATQGAWLAKTWRARFGLFAAAVVLQCAPWLTMRVNPHPLPGHLLIIAGVLAACAVFIATQRPAAGSVLGVIVALVGVAAAVFEASRGESASMVQTTFKCAAFQCAFVVPAAVLLGQHFKRAYLPARLGHVAAAACVGWTGSATVWLSCNDVHTSHLVLEHAGVVIALATACALMTRRWLQRRAT